MSETPVAFTAEVVNKTIESKTQSVPDTKDTKIECPKTPCALDVKHSKPNPVPLPTLPVNLKPKSPVYCDDPLVNAEVIRIKEERARALREEAERQAQAMARAILLEEERKQAERQAQIRVQAEIVINSERFEALTEAEKNELYMDYYINNGNVSRFLNKYPYMHNLMNKYNISQRSADYKKRCEEEKQILARIQEEQRQRELQLERERIAAEVRRVEEERIRKEKREKYEREINEVNREIQILEENLARAKQRKAQIIADNM
jgi:hypothetical protein